MNKIHDAFKTFLLAVLVAFAIANWQEHHVTMVGHKGSAAEQLRERQQRAWEKAERQAARPALTCPFRAPVFEIEKCDYDV